MPESKYAPVAHDHSAFLKKANRKAGFAQAYDVLALALAYAVVDQLLKARTRAGLGLRRYAQAVGCDTQVKLVRPKVDA